MNSLTELYQIDGAPMIAPDGDMEMSFEDIDGADAGRDESGVMHRLMVRAKVGKWSFCYSFLTAQEYAYMCSILPQEGSFIFTYPGADGQAQTCRAYLSNYSIVWRCARTGDYRNLKFNIIEC